MKNYVVSCSLNAVNDAFEKTLSELAPRTLNLNENLWVVSSSFTPKEIIDEMIKVINNSNGEKVFVFEVTENYDASFGKFLIDGQIKPN
ncbi:hypothetical protein ACFC9J_16345 [Enterococcus casseliflavus]|uniref:hypothetical protein n=1 Tax=Enterococcus casseliflavus TaxID=37734 RepID=UPI0039A72035